MNIKLFKDTFKTLFFPEDVAYNNVKDAFKNNLWQLISPHCGITDLSTKKKHPSPEKPHQRVQNIKKWQLHSAVFALSVHGKRIYTDLEARPRNEHTSSQAASMCTHACSHEESHSSLLNDASKNKFSALKVCFLSNVWNSSTVKSLLLHSLGGGKQK